MQAQEHTATSDRILESASKLFAEKGFSNVSIRDICRATGTTAPAIYYYFGSKKGLFEAAARKRISMANFIAELSSTSKAKDPRKGLDSFIGVYLSSFPERAFDAGFYLRDSASLDKASARRASEDLDRVGEVAEALIRRCVDEGLFRKADPRLAADCLLGMLNRVIFQHIHFSKRSDRETYRRFVTDLFFRAMK
ncbi:MAG: TetR/AcrR family transcriptional regulator [archaeon]|nr:MAG: TetR/AcrR family transcriptional regulator [archaeon]